MYVQKGGKMKEEMSDKKRRAVNLICYKRHRLHAKKERLTDLKVVAYLEKSLPIIIGSCGLPAYDLPDNLRRCLGGRNENEEDMVERINGLIEEWLRKIDERYGTDYAPKGYARARLIKERK